MKKIISEEEIYKSTLGEFIQVSRQNLGLSQNDLAFQLGYSSPQFVSNWERGKSQPPAYIIGKLIDILDIDAKDFMEVLLDCQKLIFEKKQKDIEFMFNKLG